MQPFKSYNYSISNEALSVWTEHDQQQQKVKRNLYWDLILPILKDEFVCWFRIDGSKRFVSAQKYDNLDGRI